MYLRIIIALCLSVPGVTKSAAQSYMCGNLTINIDSKRELVIKEYKDLNLDITVSEKVPNKGSLFYKSLEYDKSSLGNFYFELFKYDSVGGWVDIVSKLQYTGLLIHPFESEEERLKYDPEKTQLLPGEKRVLTFNLLNIMHSISPGQYALKVYFRVGNNYGYDRQGHIVTNCIQYVESIVMPFEINKSIEDPREPTGG